MPFSFRLFLSSYPFAVSTPFAAPQSVRPRSLPLAVGACAPSSQSRRESAGKSRAPPRQTPPAVPASASDFRTPPLARQVKQISCPLREKPASRRGRTLPRPPSSLRSCKSLLPSFVTSSNKETLRHFEVPSVLLERAKDSSTFLDAYQSFIGSIADHVTVLGPFLPALSAMLSGS